MASEEGEAEATRKGPEFPVDGGETGPMGAEVARQDPPSLAPVVRTSSLGTRLRRTDPAWLVIGAMVITWMAVFGRLVWLRHARIGSFSFDMGIFDQAIWLLSRPPFGDALITVRGLPIFGHHAEFAFYLLVPFYWLGAGPHFLNLLQVASMALGTVPLFLIARDRLGYGWIAVPVSAAYLLHPSLGFMAWELFHPEVMAITPLLFAYWFSLRKRWGWFAVCLVIAVAWKEDVALAALALGLLVAARGDRRVGGITAFLALGWFLFVSRVMIPYFSGSEAFYNQFFGDLGGSLPEIIRNAVNDHSLVTRRLTAPDARTYLWKMTAPFAFLPLGALGPLMLGIPQTLVNLLSVNDFTRRITYHYAALPLTALSIATVETVRNIGRRVGVRRALVGLVAASSLTGAALWGVSPIGQEFNKGYWTSPGDSRLETKNTALRMVPDTARVSATYLFVPQLTHRRVIYEFPNPFKPKNWGVRDENYPSPTTAGWLVIDRQTLGPEDTTILDNLLETGQFRVLFDENDVVVARRP